MLSKGGLNDDNTNKHCTYPWWLL